MDLNKKKFSIDIDHGFAPIYEIPDDKKQLVAELKKAEQARLYDSFPKPVQHQKPCQEARYVQPS